MPERGIRFLPREEILTYEEMERLLGILASMGIRKVRITGGEPFVRKGLTAFLRRVRAIEGIRKINLTTNGVLTASHLPELKEIGIQSINLSLDTLNREHFYKITRRDDFDKVMQCFHEILAHNIPLKINTVVMEGLNVEDILPMSRLTREYPVDVRFIEEMPFNGVNGGKKKLLWNYQRIFRTLESAYPGIYQLPSEAASTAVKYHIPGHRGTLGIIAGFSRTFCGSCNRIRITARGTLQTCLYGNGVLDIKEFLRRGASDREIKTMLKQCIGRRFKDGWEAEKYRARPRGVSESMAAIGG
jgi:cyclic pyranopterin phosphate synthase